MANRQTLNSHPYPLCGEGNQRGLSADLSSVAHWAKEEAPAKADGEAAGIYAAFSDNLRQRSSSFSNSARRWSRSSAGSSSE